MCEKDRKKRPTRGRRRVPSGMGNESRSGRYIDPPEGEWDIGDTIERYTPRDVRERWVKALRSGQFVQCIGATRAAAKSAPSSVPYAYDAIGVLMIELQVMGLEEFTEDEWNGEGLPARAAAHTGMKYETEAGVAVGGEVEIIEMMNDRGDSFKRIADALEARDKSPLDLE